MAVRESTTRRTAANLLFAVFLAGTFSSIGWDYLLYTGRVTSGVATPGYALFVGMVVLGFVGLLVLVADRSRSRP